MTGRLCAPGLPRDLVADPAMPGLAKDIWPQALGRADVVGPKRLGSAGDNPNLAPSPPPRHMRPCPPETPPADDVFQPPQDCDDRRRLRPGGAALRAEPVSGAGGLGAVAAGSAGARPPGGQLSAARGGYGRRAEGAARQHRGRGADGAARQGDGVSAADGAAGAEPRADPHAGRAGAGRRGQAAARRCQHDRHCRVRRHHGPDGHCARAFGGGLEGAGERGRDAVDRDHPAADRRDGRAGPADHAAGGQPDRRAAAGGGGPEPDQGADRQDCADDFSSGGRECQPGGAAAAGCGLPAGGGKSCGAGGGAAPGRGGWGELDGCAAGAGPAASGAMGGELHLRQHRGAALRGCEPGQCGAPVRDRAGRQGDQCAGDQRGDHAGARADQRECDGADRQRPFGVCCGRARCRHR